MKRPRKFTVGALNIVTHPHDPKRYLDLFTMAYNLKRIIPLDGDRRAYMGSFFQIGSDPLEGMEGNIYRFTEISEDAAWLNILTGDEAEPDEIEKKVEIPKHLKPNFMAVRFNFFPKTHTLVFEVSRRDPVKGKQINFSPSTAEKFFKRLLQDNTIQLAFPDVEVTVKQSSETLEQIFKIPTLKRLHIFIKRPNPNAGDLEEEIERQLEEENASSLETELRTKDTEEGLDPSKRTKAMARVALENGYVFGSGTDIWGAKMEYKTEDKPDLRASSYDEKKPYTVAFTELAKAVAKHKT